MTLKPYVAEIVFATELKTYCIDVINLIDTISLSAEFVFKLEEKQFAGIVLQRMKEAEKRYLKSYYDNKIGDWHQQLKFVAENNGVILKNSEVFKYIDQFYKNGELKEQGVQEFKMGVYNRIIKTFGGEVLAMMAYAVGCLRINDDKTLINSAEQYDRDIKQILTTKLGLTIQEIYLFDSSRNNGGVEITSYEDKSDYKDVAVLNERAVVEIISYAINTSGGMNNRTKIKVVE